MPDFTLLDQLLYCACHVFDRRRRIDAVLIEQIDHAGPEPLKSRFCNSLDVLRPAVQAYIRSSALKAEFGCDRNLLATRRHRLAEQFLVRKRAIRFCSVEERDAALERGPYQRDRLLLLRCGTVAEAQPHAAESYSGNFQ